MEAGARTSRPHRARREREREREREEEEGGGKVIVSLLRRFPLLLFFSSSPRSLCVTEREREREEEEEEEALENLRVFRFVFFCLFLV